MRIPEEGATFKEVDGKEDIEELKIYAEEVIFESALHVPQTKVTIYARTVHFATSSAQLITTPVALPVGLQAWQVET